MNGISSALTAFAGEPNGMAGDRGYDVVAACQLPKLNARVRFPLPAPAWPVRGTGLWRERARRAATEIGHAGGMTIFGAHGRRPGDNLAVFRRFFPAVVGQPRPRTEIRPMATHLPIFDQTGIGGDRHESGVRSDLLEFGKKQGRAVDKRVIFRIA